MLLATTISISWCALAAAQGAPDANLTYDAGKDAVTGALPSAVPAQFGAAGTSAATLSAADTANLEGCQVVARIDDQIVLACDVLWRVNQLIEMQRQKLAPDAKVTPEQIAVVRDQLIRREVASLVDRKLIYNEFRRNVPPENMPRIEKNLEEPFFQHEVPQLMKQLKVDNQRDLEKELARLGSSLADVQRAFNERVVAGEWLRSKVKINEDVSPDDMLQFYRTHLSDYEFPTQARWEEIVVRKSKFKNESEAYAEIARLGNEVWQRGTQQGVQGPAFVDVAKTGSDGFTAKEGGQRDWTTKGALQTTALDQAIFTLDVGQMSPILDCGDSFVIVRVLERKEAGRKTFVEAQADIREQLKNKRFEAGVEKYLAELRHDARIWTVFTGNVSADVLLGRKPEAKQQR
jgi:hypothetical protein